MARIDASLGHVTFFSGHDFIVAHFTSSFQTKCMIEALNPVHNGNTLFELSSAA
jgi:hypothetical protein